MLARFSDRGSEVPVGTVMNLSFLRSFSVAGAEARTPFTFRFGPAEAVPLLQSLSTLFGTTKVAP